LGGRASRTAILWSLFTTNFFVNGFIVNVFPPLLPEITREISLTNSQIGLIWGAFTIAIGFFTPVGGYLADRFGLKKVVAIALPFTAFFALSRAFCSTFFEFVATMFFLGVSSSFVNSNLTKCVGVWFPSRELGRANGVLLMGACTCVAAALMGSASIISPLFGGWRAAMMFTGIVTFGLFLFWILLFHEPPEHDSDQESAISISFGGSLLKLFKMRDFVALCVMEFCSIGCMVAWIGFFPKILVEKGFSNEIAGIYPGVCMLAFGLFSIVGPYFSDLFGLRKAFLWPFILVFGIGLFGQAFLLGPGLWVLILLTGISLGSANPIERTVTVELQGMEKRLLGSAMGMLFMMNRLGGAIISALLGFTFDMTGKYWIGFSIFLILNLISSGFLFFIKETGWKLRKT